VAKGGGGECNAPDYIVSVAITARICSNSPFLRHPIFEFLLPPLPQPSMLDLYVYIYIYINTDLQMVSDLEKQDQVIDVGGWVG